MTDTIFALSSGAPPAAIGVIRLSGPNASHAIRQLCGSLPKPRRASLRDLRNDAGDVLDRALVLWFPGPATATGEDLAELHCHGGRAIIAAIERHLASMPGLRKAIAGEFTRRAFSNGVIDLAEAEGLGDLLSAETEMQRSAAQAAAGGGLSRKVEEWRKRILHLSALVEAQLDFADEDDVGGLPEVFHVEHEGLSKTIEEALAWPHAERLREGIRVVLAGPPNAGKSSLFNAMLEEGAAIVSAEAGTTRDVIERTVAFSGVPFVLVDTAGLRDGGAAEIERIGIERAREELARADIVLWLGQEGCGPEGAVEVASRSDEGVELKSSPDYVVSAVTGCGIPDLIFGLVSRATELLPKPGSVALNTRQRNALLNAHKSIQQIKGQNQLLLVGEHLRLARSALDQLLGRGSTEEMLDSLFGRFCIGK